MTMMTYAEGIREGMSIRMRENPNFCPRSHFCSSIFNGLFLSFQHSGIIIFYCHFGVFNHSLEEYRFAWQ